MAAARATPDAAPLMAKHAYPEFHKTLLEQSSYGAAPRRIKFEETRHSYLYRTGEQLYKVRKTSAVYASPAMKERYAQLALTLGRRWAGEVVQAVVPIVRGGGGFALGGPGEPVDYALRMAQLPDSHWLHRLLAADKITPVLLGRLARFVAERHAQDAVVEPPQELSRAEHVGDLLDEVAYQSRKHEGHTVAQPVLEMIVRPLAHYLEETRRLLVRRARRGRIVEGHGALVCEHIYAHGSDVHALAPLEAQAKYRVLDAANDVAVLVNSLALRAAGEHAELFVKRYMTAAKDRDLPRVLPLYRILQALRGGLLRSEWAAEHPPDSAEHRELVQEAGTFYHLALEAARSLHKPA
jgi:uncharacterized protein